MKDEYNITFFIIMDYDFFFQKKKKLGLKEFFLNYIVRPLKDFC